MTAESLLERALRRSASAEASGALVPLPTSVEPLQGDTGCRFDLRHLTGAPPRHLKPSGPKPNPFLPWDPRLEVDTVGERHVVILNKYPVQIGHLLLITREWAPQLGWLDQTDWSAVSAVNDQVQGLWFFNCGPLAGASQPHRHLQLLPRQHDEPICPRDQWFRNHLVCSAPSTAGDLLGRSCVVEEVDADQLSSDLLHRTYNSLCRRAGVGDPTNDSMPRQAYNLLIGRRWMALILRGRDGVRGFSVNALGFAGYLLSTDASDRSWLKDHGGDALLRDVVKAIP